jgi:hypothetical protein
MLARLTAVWIGPTVRHAESWSSVPTVNPSSNPYRERLERYAASNYLHGIVIARPHRQWYTFADVSQVSENVVVNPGPGTAHYGMDWSQTASHTHSVEISASVSVGFLKIVEASLSTTYGYSWTTETARGENVSVEILPLYMGWIDRATLINNLEGDFIWTGTIAGGSVGGAIGVIKLPGDDGIPFRWRGISSGSAKRGALSGVLITSQAPLSSSGRRALEESGDQIKPDGGLSILSMPALVMTNHDDIIRTVVD